MFFSVTSYSKLTAELISSIYYKLPNPPSTIYMQVAVYLLQV